MARRDQLIPSERIEKAILLIRGEKVMLDADLAALYSVPTGNLIQAVKRNLDRFPGDFMYRLTAEEFKTLRSQFVISKGRGGRRYPPYAFTEHGVAMLSSVLRSKRAIQVNLAIMRTFVRLRQIMATHSDLANRLRELELKFRDHDQKFQVVFDAIRELIAAPKTEIPEMGYHTLIRPSNK